MADAYLVRLQEVQTVHSEMTLLYKYSLTYLSFFTEELIAFFPSSLENFREATRVTL